MKAFLFFFKKKGYCEMLLFDLLFSYSIIAQQLKQPLILVMPVNGEIQALRIFFLRQQGRINSSLSSLED